MDSELQAILDEWDKGWTPLSPDQDVKLMSKVFDMVKKYAHPDYEAAAEVLDPYMVHPLEVMEATKAVVAAALGITEDTGG